MTVAPPQEVSTQAKLVFPSHRSLAAQERSTRYGGPVSALLWLGHPPEDRRGLRAADRGGRHAPPVRAHLWDHDRRSVGARGLVGVSCCAACGNGEYGSAHTPHNIAKALREWEYVVEIPRTRLRSGQGGPVRCRGEGRPEGPAPQGSGGAYVPSSGRPSQAAGGNGHV